MQRLNHYWIVLLVHFYYSVRLSIGDRRPLKLTGFCSTTTRSAANTSCRSKDTTREHELPLSLMSSPKHSSTLVIAHASENPQGSTRVKLNINSNNNNNYSNNNNIEEDMLEKNKKRNMGGTWNPFSLLVLKLGFTEPAWTSLYNYYPKAKDGTYVCAYCRSPLFSSSGKYDSGSGWPSFWKTIESNRVVLERNWDGRMECKCASCNGHLGHVFSDGPMRGSLEGSELKTVPESDPQLMGYNQVLKRHPDLNVEESDESKFSRMPRFCINGVALRFEESEKNV